ncbi:MAG: hypothetical protein QNL04_14690 [SAR324 cluster bacterium]|nr:hypothetical protein [SAR324 cluster bacterium]
MEQKNITKKSPKGLSLLLMSVIVGFMSFLILSVIFVRFLQAYYPEFEKFEIGNEVLVSAGYQPFFRAYPEKGRYFYVLHYTADQTNSHWQASLGRKTIMKGKLKKSGSHSLKFSFTTHKRALFRFRVNNKAGNLYITKSSIVSELKISKVKDYLAKFLALGIGIFIFFQIKSGQIRVTFKSQFYDSSGRLLKGSVATYGGVFFLGCVLSYPTFSSLPPFARNVASFISALYYIYLGVLTKIVLFDIFANRLVNSKLYKSIYD